MYRIYDPEKGRWISRDPAGEEVGFNLYEYVNNKSVLFRDLLGLDSSSASSATNTPGNNSGNNGANSNTSTPTACVLPTPTPPLGPVPTPPSPDNEDNVFLESVQVELVFQVAEKGLEHNGLKVISEPMGPIGLFLFLNDNMNDPGLIPPNVQVNSDCHMPYNLKYP